MNNQGQHPSASAQNNQSAFARAMADSMEREKNSNNQPLSTRNESNNLFSDALSKTGGNLPKDFQPNQADMDKQQAEMKRQQQREALRKKLHDQVNPTDLREVFSSREKQVKEQIDRLRHELTLLGKDIAKLNHDIDIAIHEEVVSPGQEGKYYISFFQQLRQFIMLLRQKIQSAGTWATQMHSKKKKRSKQPGMEIGGKQHEKASTIQDMMHHEASTAYSGN